MADDELLTVEQAQEYLGVSRATLWNLVKRHHVPRYRVPVSGKRVFFKPSDLDRLRQPIKLNGEQEKLAA
jgi:excisionase family DNA binding protein